LPGPPHAARWPAGRLPGSRPVPTTSLPGPTQQSTAVPGHESAAPLPAALLLVAPEVPAHHPAPVGAAPPVPDTPPAVRFLPVLHSAPFAGPQCETPLFVAKPQHSHPPERLLVTMPSQYQLLPPLPAPHSPTLAAFPQPWRPAPRP